MGRASKTAHAVLGYACLQDCDRRSGELQSASKAAQQKYRDHCAQLEIEVCLSSFIHRLKEVLTLSLNS